MTNFIYKIFFLLACAFKTKEMKKIGSYNNFRACLALSRDTTIQMFFCQRSIHPITSPVSSPVFGYIRSCGVPRSKRVFLEAFRLLRKSGEIEKVAREEVRKR